MSVLAAPPGEIERKDIRHWPRPTDAEAQCCSLAMIIVRTPPCVESRQYEVHIIRGNPRVVGYAPRARQRVQSRGFLHQPGLYQPRTAPCLGLSRARWACITFRDLFLLSVSLTFFSHAPSSSSYSKSLSSSSSASTRSSSRTPSSSSSSPSSSSSAGSKRHAPGFSAL